MLVVVLVTTNLNESFKNNNYFKINWIESANSKKNVSIKIQ